MKKTFRFNKLIRDLLHKKMIDKGVDVKLTNLKTKKELIDYFKLKLLEEAEEVQTAETIKDLIEELADICEVVHGFTTTLGIDFEKVEEARIKKHKEKGGFENGIVIDSVHLDEEHEFAKYYLSEPRKYPEITL